MKNEKNNGTRKNVVTNSNKDNMNKIKPKSSEALGNSLFRGQKFIDFQEPFNDSIKPIRNSENFNQNRSNLISPVIKNQNNRVSNPSFNNKNFIDYNTENFYLEQLELKENNQSCEDSNIVNDNMDAIFDINNKISKLDNKGYPDSPKKDNLFLQSKYFNNLKYTSPNQNKITDNNICSPDNFTNKESFINNNNNNKSIKGRENDLILNSNKVDRSGKTKSYKGSYIGDDTINMMRNGNKRKNEKTEIRNVSVQIIDAQRVNNENPRISNKKITQSGPKSPSPKYDNQEKTSEENLFYEGRKNSHESDLSGNVIFSTKANSNIGSFSINQFLNNKISAFNNNQENIQNNYNKKKENRSELGNSLVKFQSGLIQDNSIIAINNNQNKNNDESRLYIKEILDICSGSENRMSEVSNFEIKNFDNEFIFNSNSFINNSSINCSTINPTSNVQTNKNLLNENSDNKTANKVQPAIIKKREFKGLRTEDLIEIRNRREKMGNNLSPIDIHLRRRNLESATKVERLFKEKEIPEFNPENKYKLEVYKNSKEIVKNIRVNENFIEKTHDNIEYSKNIKSRVISNDTNTYLNSSDKNITNPEPINDNFKNKENYLLSDRNMVDKNYLIDDKTTNVEDTITEHKTNREIEENIFNSKHKKMRNNSTGSVRYSNSVSIVYDDNKSYNNPPQFSSLNPRDSNDKANNNKNHSHKTSIISEKFNPNNNSKRGYDTINIDINDIIYAPSNADIKPTIETPDYKNFIVNDIVNYGTKTHNNTKTIELKIPSINIVNVLSTESIYTESDKQINNYRVSINNDSYNENNQNTNQESEDIKTSNSDLIRLNNNVVQTIHAVGEENINTNNRMDIINQESNKQNSQHLVINSIKTDTMKESMNSEQTKRSMLELFPIFDKPEFQTENLCNNFNDTARSKDETTSNLDLKLNFNTHINSGFISVDNSEINEYNSEMNKKQNQSNFNIYEGNFNNYNYKNNYNSNLNQENSHQQSMYKPSNQTNVSTNNVSVNFSKFTNFVGMSEQYSKKKFSIKNPNDISNRNMVTSYMSNDIMSTQVLNKNPSQKTLDMNNPIYYFDSKSNFLNSELLSAKHQDNNHIKFNDPNFTIPPESNRSASPILEDTKIIPIIPEINSTKDEFHVYCEETERKVNYFDRDLDNLTTSRNNIANIGNRDKILTMENHPSMNSTKTFNTINLNSNQKDIETIEDKIQNQNIPKINISKNELVQSKYLLPNQFEPPQRIPFGMNKKKLSKSLLDSNINQTAMAGVSIHEENILSNRASMKNDNDALGNFATDVKIKRNSSMINNYYGKSLNEEKSPDSNKITKNNNYFTERKNSSNKNKIMLKKVSSNINLKMNTISKPEAKIVVNYINKNLNYKTKSAPTSAGSTMINKTPVKVNKKMFQKTPLKNKSGISIINETVHEEAEFKNINNIKKKIIKVKKDNIKKTNITLPAEMNNLLEDKNDNLIERVLQTRAKNNILTRNNKNRNNKSNNTVDNLESRSPFLTDKQNTEEYRQESFGKHLSTISANLNDDFSKFSIDKINSKHNNLSKPKVKNSFSCVNEIIYKSAKKQKMSHKNSQTDLQEVKIKLPQNPHDINSKADLKTLNLNDNNNIKKDGIVSIKFEYVKDLESFLKKA